MAYGSGVVMLLTFLKSMQRHTEPSGFLIGTIGLDQGLKDGLTTPCAKRDKTLQHEVVPSMLGPTDTELI